MNQWTWKSWSSTYGLWLYILALSNQLFFSPRSAKPLSFTRPYLLEDATPENLSYLKEWTLRSYRMTWHCCIPLQTFGLWWDIPTDVDQMMISTDSYHPGSIKVQDILRSSSSEKIILAGPAPRQPCMVSRASLQTTTPRNSYASFCCMGKQVTSRLDRIFGSPHCGGQNSSICYNRCEVKLCYVTSLATGLSILRLYVVFIMPISKNTDRSTTTNHE